MKIIIKLLLFASATVWAHGEQPSSPIEQKEAAVKKSTVTKIDATLKKAVIDYMQAWKNRDFKTMLSFEDWKDGLAIEKEKYQQAFDDHFRLHDWDVTKAIPMLEEGKDTYLVLVLVTHNLPKRVSADTKVKTVRSTLRQWWQKKDGKFVHLFHVERKKLMSFGMPPNMKDSSATPNTSK